MKNFKNRFNVFLLAWSALYLSLASCSDILDAKPQQSLLVPGKLSDYQALLDNLLVMNQFGPGLSWIASDDFYTTENGYERLYFIEQNTYLWKDDIYDNVLNIADWSKPYQTIFYANMVLDGLEDLKKSLDSHQEMNLVRARALFYRAYAYYHITQAFCFAYDPHTASEISGVPLQLSSDVNMPARDATLTEIYEQIGADLDIAVEFLDEITIRSRPSKAACYALMSRISLLTGDYHEAISWVSKALLINDELLDYNTLSPTLPRPIPRSHLEENKEVVFYSAMTGWEFHVSALTFVAPELYNEYRENDLRKVLFFDEQNEGYTFKGTYSGSIHHFNGISNNELYLINAECNARIGDFERARYYLDELLEKRYLTGTFSNVDVEDDELLNYILMERRKELVGRDIRWTDLKRLNLDPKYAKTLTRQMYGQEYTLPPNDERYALPFPSSETSNNR